MKGDKKSRHMQVNSKWGKYAFIFEETQRPEGSLKLQRNGRALLSEDLITLIIAVSERVEDRRNVESGQEETSKKWRKSNDRDDCFKGPPKETPKLYIHLKMYFFIREGASVYWNLFVNMGGAGRGVGTFS